MRIRFTSFLIAICLLALSCDRQECAVCPSPDSIENVNFYLADTFRKEFVFVYNSAAGKIVDSLPTTGINYDNIEVTADEQFLILSLSGGSTTIMDIVSGQTVKQLGFGGEVEVSRNGSYIAIQGDSLRFLETANWSVIRLEPFAARGGNFDESGNVFDVFFHDTTANRYEIKRYDIPGNSVQVVQSSSFPRPIPGGQVLPFAEGKKALVRFDFPDATSIEFYDYEIDSGWPVRILGATNPDMKLTPDGRRILITDPAFAIGTPSNFTTGNVFLFDTERHEFADIIPPLNHIYTDTSWGPLNPGEIAISPGGQLALVGTGTLRTPYFGLIDIEAAAYLKLDSMGIPGASFGYPTSVACRKR